MFKFTLQCEKNRIVSIIVKYRLVIQNKQDLIYIGCKHTLINKSNSLLIL